MTDAIPFAELTLTNEPSPDYPYCPITGHTDYLLDVNDGDIRLTCTTCHLQIEPDLLDAFGTGCEIPVTVEFSSDPGDGWEFGPEFSGTITPRDGANQLRAERDTWKGRALGLQTERDQLAEKLTAATRTIAELAARRDELEQELLTAYADDDPEPLTLRDVDPGYVAQCEEDDRIAEMVYEPEYSDEGPF